MVSNLEKNGGRCDCRKHTFLRGNDMSQRLRFTNGWYKNHCNALNGWFTKNCEDIKAEGTNKVTVCPKNKFWTGIANDGGKGLDQSKFKCCEADYHEPQIGNHPLPDTFKDDNGKFSFQ